MAVANTFYAEGVFEDRNGVLPILHGLGSTSGVSNLTVVSGVANKRIRVLSALFSSDDTTNSLEIALKTTTNGSQFLGYIFIPINTTVILPFNQFGWLDTLTGEDLQFVTTGAGSAVRHCSIRYIQYAV